MTLHRASILTLQDYVEPHIWLSEILNIVAREYQLPMRVLVGSARDKLATRARFAFYYLAREMGQKSFREVANKVSRERTSAMYGDQEVRRHRERYEPELSRCISELQRKSIPEPQPSVPRTAVAATGAVPQEASAPVAPISRVLP